jgi:hypothetical protein
MSDVFGVFADSREVNAFFHWKPDIFYSIFGFLLPNISKFNDSTRGLSKKVCYVRMVDSPREEGTRYEKRHEYAALFLSGSELSAPRKKA